MKSIDKSLRFYWRRVVGLNSRIPSVSELFFFRYCFFSIGWWDVRPSVRNSSCRVIKMVLLALFSSSILAFKAAAKPIGNLLTRQTHKSSPQTRWNTPNGYMCDIFITLYISEFVTNQSIIIRGYRDALYKSTFYLLTYLLTNCVCSINNVR